MYCISCDVDLCMPFSSVVVGSRRRRKAGVRVGRSKVPALLIVSTDKRMYFIKCTTLDVNIITFYIPI